MISRIDLYKRLVIEKQARLVALTKLRVELDENVRQAEEEAARLLRRAKDSRTKAALLGNQIDSLREEAAALCIVIEELEKTPTEE